MERGGGGSLPSSRDPYWTPTTSELLRAAATQRAFLPDWRSGQGQGQDQTGLGSGLGMIGSPPPLLSSSSMPIATAATICSRGTPAARIARQHEQAEAIKEEPHDSCGLKGETLVLRALCGAQHRRRILGPLSNRVIALAGMEAGLSLQSSHAG